ncbi:DNA-directed RNA polymerase I subunit RPA43 [Rhincodon typus]|uniref:DNA-directed RNA polymerase I subunit RPA43 n=1 Tax=Rhincodon typus TaxID=259920 RepID=UPI00202E8064|nr:DNA-directed RNA polymerase I subunit RPA43 [Rhincodon typus]
MGIVNKVAPSHLGCLVHGCFNASIPKPHKANGTWPGFAVAVGDSLKFEVLQLDADVAGVLCIRGQLLLRLQATCVDSEGPLENNSGEQNDGIVRKKKKKKKKDEKWDQEVEETVNDEILDKSCHEDQMEKAEIILESKKHKKKKRKTGELNVDTEIHGRDDSDYFSDKAVKKKKRKLSEGDSEHTGYAQEAKRKKKF